jgi:type III secretion system low calcium response chaperone LcrH/SycD
MDMSDAGTIKIGELEVSGLTAEQKAALDIVAKGGTLKDVRGLTDEDIETVYTIGFNLYKQGKYGEAEPLFEFACLYSNVEERYWVALGSCRQMLKNYKAAIDAYGFGYLLDSDNPWPVIHTAVCYLALSDKAQAKDALQLAEQTIAQAKPDAAATQRIAALRQAL